MRKLVIKEDYEEVRSKKRKHRRRNWRLLFAAEDATVRGIKAEINFHVI